MHNFSSFFYLIRVLKEEEEKKDKQNPLDFVIICGSRKRSCATPPSRRK
jgi:hypothetical protein